ncbi:MAG TPA: EF-P lysine aminoacylase EpmA [Polyangiaceae bacterium]
MKLLAERARVVRAVRAFFESRGFVEVETPAIVPSPGMDLHLDAFAVERGYLITSPEYQMKRLLADGWERIFQIARCFRRGERGAQHNPEFTMVEWYRGNGGAEDVMRDTEQLAAAVSGGAFRVDGRVIDGRPPFSRITVCDAFQRFAGVSEADVLAWAASDEDRYFRTWVERVEPRIAEMDRAVFVVDYPAPMASLARQKPSDARFCERFELYVAGIELCNGFGELTDPREQRARFEHDQAARKARGLPVYPIDEKFMAALERGMPPSGGNALGVDRLVALVCGTTDIRRVIAFSADDV